MVLVLVRRSVRRHRNRQKEKERERKTVRESGLSETCVTTRKEVTHA